jgi:predicted DNA-binding protein with PD1-like motif
MLYQGESMRSRQAGSVFVLRIDRGEEILESIKKFCIDTTITFGSVQGIGAAGRLVIGFFETGTKKYHSREFVGDYEITSLLGNISTLDGLPYLHLHVTVSDGSLQAFGGHLSEAVVSGTCEVIITSVKDQVTRSFDTEVGLNLLELYPNKGETMEP